jgi:hypothetical protein
MRRTPSTTQNRYSEWPLALLTAIGWGVMLYVMFMTLVITDLMFNFFNWDFAGGVERVISLRQRPHRLAVFLAFPVAPILLAADTRHGLARAAGWTCALGMAGLGLYGLPPESLSPETFLGRDQVSPLWFRITRFGGFCYPATVLAIWTLVERRWAGKWPFQAGAART